MSNFFFTGSPFSIDTDDGSDMVNATANVVFKQPLFKTDFGGHTKACLHRRISLVVGTHL